jgi:hypothetical protein
MYEWERLLPPLRILPPQDEIEAVIREADADMPAHIEDPIDQRAYLGCALRERWPELTASDALYLVKGWGR